jgi:hypothetical protein
LLHGTPFAVVSCLDAAAPVGITASAEASELGAAAIGGARALDGKLVRSEPETRPERCQSAQGGNVFAVSVT